MKMVEQMGWVVIELKVIVIGAYLFIQCLFLSYMPVLPNKNKIKIIKNEKQQTLKLNGNKRILTVCQIDNITTEQMINSHYFYTQCSECIFLWYVFQGQKELQSLLLIFFSFFSTLKYKDRELQSLKLCLVGLLLVLIFIL